LQHALLQRMAGHQQEMVVCILDNRGVGNSSSPVSQNAYSTQLMAQDALAIMVRPACWVWSKPRLFHTKRSHCAYCANAQNARFAVSRSVAIKQQ
jgi:hypothetical protein